MSTLIPLVSGRLADDLERRLGQNASDESAWQREMERAQLAGWFHSTTKDGHGEASVDKVGDSAPTATLSPKNSRLSAANQQTTASLTLSHAQNQASGRWSGHQISAAPRTQTTLQAVATIIKPGVTTGQSGQTWLDHTPLLVALGQALSMSAEATPTSDTASGKSTDAPGAALEYPVMALSVISPLRPQSTSVRPTDHTHVESASEVSSDGHMPLTEESPSIRLHAEWSPDGVTVWLGIDGDPTTIGARLAVVVSELQRALADQKQELRALVCNGKTVFEEGAVSSVAASGMARFYRPQESFSYVFTHLYRQEA